MDSSIESAPGVIANTLVGSIGDGCLVRCLSADRRSLHTVAVDHREGEVRDRLGDQLHGQVLPKGQAGWAAHVLGKHAPVILTGPAATQAVLGDLIDMDPDVGQLAATAAVAPLRRAGRTVGAVVVFRGPEGPRYSMREQLIISEIAAGMRGRTADPSRTASAEALLEQNGAAVWASDLQGRTTFANSQAASLLGVPSAGLVGQSMRRFLGPQWPESVSSLAAWPSDSEHELVRADGEQRWVSITSAPLTDERGRRSGAVHCATDTTERKRREGTMRMALAAHQAVGELVDHARAGEPLLGRATALVAEQMSAEYVTVSAVQGGKHVVPRTTVGWDRRLLGRTVPFSTRSATGLCLDDDRPYTVTDYQAVDGVEMGELARQAEARSAVCIGIGSGLGVMGIVSPRPDAFANLDLSFLRTVSWLLSSGWTQDDSRPALRAV